MFQFSRNLSIFAFEENTPQITWCTRRSIRTRARVLCLHRPTKKKNRNAKPFSVSQVQAVQFYFTKIVNAHSLKPDDDDDDHDRIIEWRTLKVKIVYLFRQSIEACVRGSLNNCPYWKIVHSIKNRNREEFRRDLLASPLRRPFNIKFNSVIFLSILFRFIWLSESMKKMNN